MIYPEDQEKMRIFLQRLLGKEHLKDATPTAAEQQILIFLLQNESSMQQLLSQQNFFPDLTWKEIKSLFVSVLRELIINRMKILVPKVIEKTIDFSFLQTFNGINTSPDEIKKQLENYIIEHINNKDFRTAVDMQFKLFLYKYSEKYLIQIFERKTYIYNELHNVDKINLEPIKYSDYIKIILLLKNYIHIPITIAKDKQISYMLIKGNKKAAEKLLNTKKSELIKTFINIPKKIIEVAINSNLDANENPYIEGAAKFTAILDKRSASYNPKEKLDRGAEYPDKSWFNITKRNYLFHGFDKKMLDELYFITADMGW